MIVNVRMNDGHTTFQFASRGDLRAALGYEPGEDQRVIKAWAKWNPEDPAWVPVRLPFVRKHSVAFVVAAEDVATTDADLPAKEVAEERARKWSEKKADVEAELAEFHRVRSQP